MYLLCIQIQLSICENSKKPIVIGNDDWIKIIDVLKKNNRHRELSNTDSLIVERRRGREVSSLFFLRLCREKEGKMQRCKNARIKKFKDANIQRCKKVWVGVLKKRGFGLRSFGDSAAIRTQDPQLRRLLLYPAELRNH